jgi:hypothetical protein
VYLRPWPDLPALKAKSPGRLLPSGYRIHVATKSPFPCKQRAHDIRTVSDLSDSNVVGGYITKNSKIFNITITLCEYQSHRKKMDDRR